MNGAGMYPNALYENCAIELAELFCLSGTELSIHPINTGTQQAPQNIISHIQVQNIYDCLTKGTGIESKQLIHPAMTATFWAFRVEYPPRYEVTTPPIINPDKGAVILDTATKEVAIYLSTNKTVII